MTIPAQFANRYVYHFTHIDNLPSLLQVGFLANNHPLFPQAGSRSIAASSIQGRRANMAVPCGAGGVVHDYVPFYFGSLSPMLLGVVNKKNIDQWDILYFEYPISLITRCGAVFTDASANTVTPSSFFDNPQHLTQLNWTEIDSLKWKSQSEELRHQRMAEALIPNGVIVQDASRVVVWNASAKQRVQEIVSASGVPFPSIEFESPSRRHYFTKFNPPSEKGQTLVTGPNGIAASYQSACDEILALRDQQGAQFGTLKDLLVQLRVNFACIPHTESLVGLKSENGLHKLTVDMHTHEVVQKLLSLDEFDPLPQEQQEILELAAYLHDIGKGPRSRWEWNNGLQKVDPDHPVRAMPMMVEIIRDCVANATSDEVRTLLKLVCYHDLVGEVLGKERDERQLMDVAETERDLELLFILGKADATALSEAWWDATRAAALYARCRQAIGFERA